MALLMFIGVSVIVVKVRNLYQYYLDRIIYFILNLLSPEYGVEGLGRYY